MKIHSKISIVTDFSHYVIFEYFSVTVRNFSHLKMFDYFFYGHREESVYHLILLNSVLVKS